MKNVFSKFKGFILDLDGVIYLDKQLIPFSKKFIDYLNKEDKRYVFLTNDSSLSPKAYSKILNKLGIKCTEKQVVTPITNFIEILRKDSLMNDQIMVFSSKELKNFIKKEKIKIIENPSRYKDSKSILVSGNINFNYKDLMYASLCVQNGAKLYATSIDNSYPTALGNVPATGSLIAAIKKTFPTPVTNLGKPSKKIFKLAQERLNIKKSEILMIGDNLKTDIAGSNSFGIKSALVTSGKTSLQSARNSKIKPDFILKNLKI